MNTHLKPAKLRHLMRCPDCMIPVWITLNWQNHAIISNQDQCKQLFFIQSQVHGWMLIGRVKVNIPFSAPDSTGYMCSRLTRVRCHIPCKHHNDSAQWESVDVIPLM